MNLRSLGYFDEGVLVSAILRPPAMTRPKEKIQKPPPVLTDAKLKTPPQSRRNKKNRKGRKSRKPLLIFSGGFETSRRRH
jgi:hypothetical protein